MPKHNDPFYFALPRPTTKPAVERAKAHIAKEFGIEGKVELARIEPAYSLLRVVSS